ncbi:MAG: hypothetical protein KF716_20070 [Anaerolineae bacterium]|nr:hypothetical protein [Anaerolineae bacterium]
MTIQYSNPSIQDYKAIPDPIRKKFKRKLSLLASHGITYPGLNAQKMVNEHNIWEARIDIHYRFTFEMDNDIIVVRRIGTHEIYRKP